MVFDCSTGPIRFPENSEDQQTQQQQLEQQRRVVSHIVDNQALIPHPYEKLALSYRSQQLQRYSGNVRKRRYLSKVISISFYFFNFPSFRTMKTHKFSPPSHLTPEKFKTMNSKGNNTFHFQYVRTESMKIIEKNIKLIQSNLRRRTTKRNSTNFLMRLMIGSPVMKNHTCKNRKTAQFMEATMFNCPTVECRL